ncbi:MAG TPA: sigma-70 family RNA polymerase sigma factor [Lysobacter sp.]|nr:sigma-70 family RNA polymerase sigma factor [Lysobacter sp.]
MTTVVPFRTATMAFPQEPAPDRAPNCEPADEVNHAERWSMLMARAQDGDQHAYRALLYEITPYLRAIARRFLGVGGEVEDAVQEILLIVHSIRHTYERDRPFKPWLSTIASRRLIDLLRGRSRRLRHEIETEDEDAVFNDAAADQADRQPDHIAARADAVREVRRAVDALPPRQREAVALLRLQELTLDEAAGASKQSAGALKVACHRALKSLQSVFHHRPEP